MTKQLQVDTLGIKSKKAKTAFKLYLIFVILSLVLLFISGILTYFYPTNQLILNLINVITLLSMALLLVLSFIFILYFIKNKCLGITLIVPISYLIYLLPIYIAGTSAVMGISMENFLSSSVGKLTGAISVLFYYISLIFSIYILSKFRDAKNDVNTKESRL